MQTLQKTISVNKTQINYEKPKGSGTSISKKKKKLIKLRLTKKKIYPIAVAKFQNPANFLILAIILPFMTPLPQG